MGNPAGKRILLLAAVSVIFLFAVSLYFALSSAGFFGRMVLGAGLLAFKISFSIFRVLFLRSLKVIWLPAALYLAISWFIRNNLMKKIVLLAVISFNLLFLANVVFPSPFSLLFAFTRLPILFCLLVQLYLFLLFLLPFELWNIPGAIILFVKGSMVTLLPDLPSFADDFGIIMAVFYFVFLYLNTVAALLKRAGRREAMETVDKLFEDISAFCDKAVKTVKGFYGENRNNSRR